MIEMIKFEDNYKNVVNNSNVNDENYKHNFTDYIFYSISSGFITKEYSIIIKFIKKKLSIENLTNFNSLY